jgi:uncharacterized membrane protein
MRAAILISDVLVLFFGTLLMLTPAITRPTVQCGVRIPPERISAPVLRDQRRAYYRRAGAIVVCCTAVAVALADHGSWWLPKIVLLIEVAAELGCFLLARRKIVAVKDAERWFAGLRQTVVADTSWRADPPRFPVRWLVPALAVIAATVAVGATGPRPVIGIVTGFSLNVGNPAAWLIIAFAVAAPAGLTVLFYGLGLVR